MKSGAFAAFFVAFLVVMGVFMIAAAYDDSNNDGIPYNDEYVAISIEPSVELDGAVVIALSDSYKWSVTTYEDGEEVDGSKIYGYGDSVDFPFENGLTYKVVLKSGHTHIIWYMIDPAANKVTSGTDFD